MAGITQEVRTIMYSVEPSGNVAVHKFPFNANDRDGMEKLQRFVKRGFTFADPRIQGSPNTPLVIVTGAVDLAKPVLVEKVDEQVDEVATETAGPPEAQVTTMPSSEGPVLSEVEGLQAEGSVRGQKAKRKYTKRKKRVNKK